MKEPEQASKMKELIIGPWLNDVKRNKNGKHCISVTQNSVNKSMRKSALIHHHICTPNRNRLGVIGFCLTSAQPCSCKANSKPKTPNPTPPKPQTAPTPKVLGNLRLKA